MIEPEEAVDLFAMPPQSTRQFSARHFLSSAQGVERDFDEAESRNLDKLPLPLVSFIGSGTSSPSAMRAAMASSIA